MSGGTRLFQQAVANMYPGSRRQKQRFSYGGITVASFIELTPKDSQGPPEDVINSYRHALQAVPGVLRVIKHTKGSKEDQGNKSDGHYQ